MTKTPLSDAEAKIKHGSEIRRCMLTLDVSGMRALWKEIAPHLYQGTDKETLYSLHLARTEAQSIPLHLRRYSDRWLRDRGFGSHLPEHLRINKLGNKL